jgi:cell division protein FtsB
MTGTRGRRGIPAAGTRRSTGRPLSRAASRPLRSGDRAAALRPAARPSVRRSSRTATTASAPRRPLFTGRTVLLAGLVLLLALTLAGPIRGFLAGRAQLAQLAAEGSALEQRAQQLQTQLDAQGDPSWATRQARERLAYVLPGDRLITVVDGTTVAGDAGTLPSSAQHAATPPPWYQGLLESVATADRDGAPGKP